MALRVELCDGHSMTTYGSLDSLIARQLIFEM